MPDLGFNTRFEKAGFGHLQFSTMFRDLGAKDGLGEDHHVFGWGVNLSAGIDLTKKDSLQLLGVYGEGVGGMGNDAGFLNSDAAFSSSGTSKPCLIGVRRPVSLTAGTTSSAPLSLTAM